MTRNSIYFLIGRVPSAAIGFLNLFLVTRVLNQTDYGRYSVMVAIAGLISGFGFQWLRQCLVKFASDPKCDRRELLGTIGLLSLAILTLIIIAATLLSLILVNKDSIGNSPLITATVILAVSQALFELGSDAIRVDMNPVRYGIAGLLRASFCLAFGLLGHWLYNTLIGMVLGISLGYILAQLLTAPKWLITVSLLHHASRTRMKELAGYGLPLALTLGFAFIVDSADRLMLAALVSAQEAGTYSSAYNLGQYALGTILGSLGLAAFPSAAKCYATHGVNRTATLLGQNLLLLVGFALPLTLGLMVISPVLTALMLGNFVPGESALVTSIILVSVAFSGVRAYAYDVVFMITHKTKQQAAILAAAAGLNILINLMLIPIWGAIGAASATLISFGFALGLSVYFGSRLIKISIKIGDILKIILSSFMMVSALINTPLYNTWSSLLFSTMIGSITYIFSIFIMNPFEVRRKLLYYFRERT